MDMPALSNKKFKGYSILSLGLEAIRKFGRKIPASTWVPKIIAANQNCP
jgi:hypothetical protein